MSPVPADPSSLPPRADLSFLTRRSARPARPPAASGGPGSGVGGPGPSAGSGSGGAALSSFVAGHATHHEHHSPVPPKSAAAAPARPPAAEPPSSSASLDLDDAPEPSTTPRLTSPAAPPVAARVRPRVAAGEQVILGARRPAVWLTRVQSGVGELGIEAIVGHDADDLRLAAAYQLASGPTGTVQSTDGNRYAPSTRRPVLVAGRDEHQRVSLDLRQARELERLAVIAYSDRRTELTWSGVLRVSTVGGARVELPLDTLRAGTVAVLAGVYQVDGELVVRAELEVVDGDVREAARAYGYDRITWRDSRSPVE